ncbi:MAG: class I SAM-dependent RNA methyltransferase [Sciscionella sp.]
MMAAIGAGNWTGRTVELRVGAVAHGGFCVARVDGRVVFVRHALPGELVLAHITEDRGGSFCRADAVEVLESSRHRVAAPCPVSGPGGCGGCDFQHVDPAAQRELKADVVAEQLRRLAGVQWPVEVEALPGDATSWRTRTRFAVDGDGAPGFRAHRSHQVIPVVDCPITVRAAVAAVTARRFTPYGEVEVVADDAGDVHMQEVPPARSGRRGTPRQVAGDGIASQRAIGRRWRLAATGFWQVHAAAAETLAAVVAEFAEAPDGGAAWDLYGGAGLFGAVLAGQVGERGSVLVVEASRDAVNDGRRNLADLPQARFLSAKVAAALARGIRPARPDVVVLDPPRKGAGREVVGGIVAAGPQRVVYVACDPAALARDVAGFAGLGYQLTRLRAFDAFPMTHHVECVALFTAVAP